MATDPRTFTPAVAASRVADELTPAAYQFERSLFGAWHQYLQQSAAAFFEVQKTSLELGLRLMDAAASANRRPLEAWLSTVERSQGTVQEVLSTWASESDSALESAQRTSQRTANRVKREAERAASQAEQAIEQERERLERERAKPAPSQEHASAAAESPAINVVKREDDWAVIRDDAQRATGVFDTKREAVERARELAKHDGAEVHIENSSGSGDAGNKAKGR